MVVLAHFVLDQHRAKLFAGYSYRFTLELQLGRRSSNQIVMRRLRFLNCHCTGTDDSNILLTSLFSFLLRFQRLLLVELVLRFVRQLDGRVNQLQNGGYLTKQDVLYSSLHVFQQHCDFPLVDQLSYDEPHCVEILRQVVLQLQVAQEDASLNLVLVSKHHVELSSAHPP